MLVATTAVHPDTPALSRRAVVVGLASALLIEVVAAGALAFGRWGGLVPATIGGALLVVLAGAWLVAADAPAGARLCRALRFLPAAVLMTALLVNPITRDDTMTAAGWTTRGPGLALLVVLGLSRLPPVWLAAACLPVGVVLRAVTFAARPPYGTGDMLGLVTRAARRLLEGHSPYAVYQMPWPLPLTYLPGTLLPYVPVELLVLDPRWPGALAELALLAVVGLALFRSSPGWRHHPGWLLVAALYLSPSSIEWARFTAAGLGWWALAAALLAVMRGGGAVAIGVAAATTPLVAPALPLVACVWVRDMGPRRAPVRVLVAVGVAATLMLPFLLWAPRAFIDGTVLWFNDLERFPRQKWEGSRTWLEYPGFAGLAWTLGIERVLKPLQAVAVLGVAVLYARRGAPAEKLPEHAAAAFLLFMAFNPVLWPYLYQPALIAAAIAAAIPFRSAIPGRYRP